MNLIDDEVTVDPLIFTAMVEEFPSVFEFDWDAAWAVASEPVEPWQWEWRTPLRALQQQLIGSSDVTGWTAEAGRELAAVLKEPVSMHGSLLELRAAETGLLPTVTSNPDAGAVSAAGDE